MAISLLGFTIKRKNDENENLTSVVPRNSDDGSEIREDLGNTHFGTYYDVEGNNFKNEKELITMYRDTSNIPEVSMAVEDIVNEAIIYDNDSAVNLNLEELDYSDSVKKSIHESFDEVLSLLSFNTHAHDIFKRWYIDGRLPYHIMVNTEKPKKGIQELRYIDPLFIKRVKKVKTEVDPKTGLKVQKDKGYIYEFDDGDNKAEFSEDSIAYITSGILDPTRKYIVSNLHKALRPSNQLKMLENAIVIYRLSRAPERRVFYVDVGNLPRNRAQQYLNEIKNAHRKKVIYDAETGNLKDDKRHMSMLEDFWLPRREGTRGTEVTTLQGGENLSQIEDIEYFQKKLYRSLNVPINRLDSEDTVNFGRASEITRDEVRFHKFIEKVRTKFSDLLYHLLKIQLVLKGTIKFEDWDSIKDSIKVNFKHDNFFYELKNFEILSEKVSLVRDLDNFQGKYFSREWIFKEIMNFTDDDIEEITKQIEKEKETLGDDDSTPRF